MKGTTRSISLILAVVLLISTLAICVYAEGEVKTGVGFVTASALRLRSGPSTDTTTLDYAYNGDAVVVLEKTGDWYRVIFNLQEGYMHSAYLSVLDRENVELGYGTVNSYCVNLRSGPSTDYSLVAQAYEGSKAYIIGINNGWYKVIYKDDVCYVRSDLLDLTEYPYENRASSNVPKFFRGGNSLGVTPSAAALSGSSASSEDSSSDTAVSLSAGDEIVAKAKEYLGVPYVWGGSSPSGFDCSGFVQYVMRACGYTVGRGSDAQYFDGEGTYVSKDELVPGDMVFFAGTYATSGTSHVGIYIGDGNFIHASSSGSVKITDLYSSYYVEHYYGARRVF